MTTEATTTRARAETPFADLVDLCGLTLDEAAIFFGVAPNTARRRATGRLPTAQADLEALGALWAIILTTENVTDAAGRPLPAGAIARRRGLRLLPGLGAALPYAKSGKGATPSAPSTPTSPTVAQPVPDRRSAKNEKAVKALSSDPNWSIEGVGALNAGDIIRITERKPRTMSIPGAGNKPQEIRENGRKIHVDKTTIYEVTGFAGDQAKVRVIYSHCEQTDLAEKVGSETRRAMASMLNRVAEEGRVTMRIRDVDDLDRILTDLPSTSRPADPFLPAADAEETHTDTQSMSDQSASTDAFDDLDGGSDDREEEYLEPAEEKDDDDPFDPSDTESDGISGLRIFSNPDENEENISC